MKYFNLTHHQSASIPWLWPGPAVSRGDWPHESWTTETLKNVISWLPNLFDCICFSHVCLLWQRWEQSELACKELGWPIRIEICNTKFWQNSLINICQYFGGISIWFWQQSFRILIIYIELCISSPTLIYWFKKTDKLLIQLLSWKPLMCKMARKRIS